MSTAPLVILNTEVVCGEVPVSARVPTPVFCQIGCWETVFWKLLVTSMSPVTPSVSVRTVVEVSLVLMLPVMVSRPFAFEVKLVGLPVMIAIVPPELGPAVML